MSLEATFVRMASQPFACAYLHRTYAFGMYSSVFLSMSAFPLFYEPHDQRANATERQTHFCWGYLTNLCRQCLYINGAFSPLCRWSFFAFMSMVSFRCRVSRKGTSIRGHRTYKRNDNNLIKIRSQWIQILIKNEGASSLFIVYNKKRTQATSTK